MTTKLPLSHIALELTDRCNLACRYCYNVWKIPGAVGHKSFNSYAKSVSVLEKLFEQADVENVTLTGGETFMADRLLEVALFCRMAGKSVTVISNGSLGKESDYATLLKMGVRLFEMPIHSANPQIHDYITRVEGSWQKSVDSLRTIQKLGGYPVAVIVLTKYNADCIAETFDYIHSLGIKRIMLNRYNIGGNGTANPASVSATHSQLCRAFAIANSKAEEHDLVISSNVCTPVCLLNPKDYPRLMFGYCSADVLLKPVTLDINGNIRLCNHSPVVAGNIYESALHDILYSDYANSWNESIPRYCTNCKAWERCRGGCRAASEQCGLGLTHVDPILTEFQLQG